MNWGRLMKRLHRARGMPLDVDGSKRQEQLVRLVLEHPDVAVRSEEHTSELQSPCNLVCRLLLEKKKHLNQTREPRRQLDMVTALDNGHCAYLVGLCLFYRRCLAHSMVAAAGSCCIHCTPCTGND